LTPANDDGLGTDGRMAKGALPITGVAILLPAEDMDLVELEVRLPRKMQELSTDIVTAVEHHQGT